VKNNAIESVKFVEPRQRPTVFPTGSGELGELLALVRDTALKRIDILIATLFENIDDALFDLAGKAESNAVQTTYFDCMRDVRKKRQRVGRLLQKLLTDVFDDFAEGKLPRKAESSGQPCVDLNLVEDNDLEESLAIVNTISKAESRLASQLFAISQRLSMIRGGAKVDNANNPIAPALLCQTFRLAMREFDLTDRARLMIYKLFDRYVMSGLDAIYDELNAQLVHAGVLPQIRHGLPHGGSLSRPARPNEDDPNPKAHMHGADEALPHHYPQQLHDPIDAQLRADIYNTVRSLLANRRPPDATGARPSDYMSGMETQRVVPTELLAALSLLQHEAMLAKKHASSAADAAQVVQQIKQELLDLANKFRGGEKIHVVGADEDTIDLVGMLFEFVLQDRNLLAPMQVLLGRLQIPFLKVALLDKHLFAQKNHPARQLLDSMAHACMGWSEESDRDRRLHDRVKQTVESLLKDFDDDPSIFERTRVEFENFLEVNKRRADLAEQRTAQATRGREKLHEARRIAAREILKRINGKQLPEIIYNVLTRPWANYLVLTLLRQGEDCDDWRHALEFADAFTWSGEPKTSEGERARLTSLLPELERSLRNSLGTVAYNDRDLKQLLHELNSLYSDILNGKSATSEQSPLSDTDNGDQGPLRFKPASTAAATAAAVESAVEEMVTRGDTEEATPEPISAEDDECLEQAREMKIGAWIEFTDPDTADKQRAKLSWISPISGKYLFVNRMGLKVSDKTVVALATEIRRGITVILEGLPLFDRALDAIIKHLKAECVASLAD
jgi:Protein of unknown function (DUF1631)